MKNSSYYQATLLSILVILAFSTFTPTLAFAAPLANNDKDWQYVNGNSWAWNYSPQDQINKNNVGNLEVKWIFPLGSKALAPAGMQAIQGFTEGTTTPPVDRDGTMTTYSTSVMYARNCQWKWAASYMTTASDTGSPEMHSSPTV